MLTTILSRILGQLSLVGSYLMVAVNYAALGQRRANNWLIKQQLRKMGRYNAVLYFRGRLPWTTPMWVGTASRWLKPLGRSVWLVAGTVDHDRLAGYHA